MAPDPQIVTALGATDLFGSLDKRALGRVASAAKIVKHPTDKELATQGELGVAFHLILEGNVTVEVAGRPAKRLKAGDYFGEISMIDGQPRSASVTADGDLTTIALTSWAFRPLLSEEPSVTTALLLEMCARLRSAERVDPA